MASFKQARDLLLYSYCKKRITTEQLMLMLDENTSDNPEFDYTQYERFDLQSVPEAECISNFRFERGDIPILADALGLPETFHCYQRTTARKVEGLCVLLRRLAFPCRYADMIPMFGRPVPELSLIANEVIDCIYNGHSHRILEWNETLLSSPKLQLYADAIHRKGAALSNCFGFVDGTIRPICRPKKNQRIVYNGHKRVHSLKFQTVSLPNGMIANMFGPLGMTYSFFHVHK